MDTQPRDKQTSKQEVNQLLASSCERGKQHRMVLMVNVFRNFEILNIGLVVAIFDPQHDVEAVFLPSFTAIIISIFFF